MVAAWSNYMSCLHDVYSWILMFGCSLDWTLAVESYWWQFIGCSSFPF